MSEHETATSIAHRLNQMTPEDRREWFDELQFSLGFCSACYQDMRDGQFVCSCENDE